MPDVPLAPVISIVTPTYNRAHLLPRTWASVAQQTERDFEWIVVDDGSTDETRAVVLAFDDPRIRYFLQENQGANGARNRGDLEARADYVVYLDSDDELLDEAVLADMLSEIRMARPDIAWISFPLVDGEGRLVSSYPSGGRTELNYVDRVCGQTIRGDFISIYRRDATRIAAWPPFQAVESLRLWRIARHRPSMVVNRPALICHRYRSDNLTSVASVIRRAGDTSNALAQLIDDHASAWKLHCPCRLGHYRFRRATYVALSDSAIRAVPDLLVGFRYGSLGIRAQTFILLAALVFPKQIRRWLFKIWSGLLQQYRTTRL